ncbi:AzlC family ABC transporter permease [Alkalibacterium kapii]|uniref:Branched-chain amino acid ABC transporter n=1 Tax=Alkalibacterium kapii TaxID=426704 RepID=A0A511AQM8_9LACT|nr:AzlC family ABC transporter permease [Alkalibacterium kapii]GEK90505.1 branched-chain amino acid ABC transporter [Alkalibacterium kapii]
MGNTAILKGLKAGLPIMASYTALGLACGIVLFDAGFSVMSIFLMSLLVYAGAAQFLAGSMVVLGASVPSIILMVFFLNLRHILMAASISKHVKNKSVGFLALFGHTLSDESFGINYSNFQKDNWTVNDAIVTNFFNYSVWAVSTALGGVIGSQFIINTQIMNYALIAMFICMMVMQFVSKTYIITAVISIVLSVFFTLLLKHNIALVIATLLASMIGYYIEVNSKRTGVRSND